MVIFMEYRKNDIVTLKIEDCGIDGEGIGKADGFTVFVKDAVIGDTVRAKISVRVSMRASVLSARFKATASTIAGFLWEPYSSSP